MKDLYSDKFINSIKLNDINGIKTIPKADLHNHFALGGNREHIKMVTGIDIPYLNSVLSSMQDMHN